MCVQLGHDVVDNVDNIWLMTNQGLARRSPDGSYEVTGYPAGLTVTKGDPLFPRVEL